VKKYSIAKIAELAGAYQAVGIAVEGPDSGASKVLLTPNASSLGAIKLAVLIREVSLRLSAAPRGRRNCSLVAPFGGRPRLGLLMLFGCLGCLPQPCPWST